MNDAERDAWLREALRHAPDAGALPPHGVSEAILAEARANARPGQALPPGAARGSRAAPRHPLAAFWDWLARPPVAASFATVMVATLVGLMWWDRPMDETLARRPEVTSEPAATPAPREIAPAQSTAPVAKNEPAAPAAATTTAPTAAPRAADDSRALAQAPRPRRQLPAEQGAAARDAKARTPVESEKRKVDDAVVAKENAERVERKTAKPAPFPTTNDERTTTAAAPSLAKKDAERGIALPADAAAPAGKAVAESSVAAAPPPAAPTRPPESARLRAAPETPTVPAARRTDQEEAQPSTANSGVLDAAKSTPAPQAQAVPTPRGGARADAREQQASAFASPAPPAPRNELAAAQRESRSATATPLAAVLASIASEPARWSRASANGGVVALDAGWRDWLAQLDAAANGRWRRVGGDGGAATNSERDGATTLRLVSAGRPAGVVWLDGTSVRTDGIAPGERWQAILPAPAAEQLRAAADRLPR
jgi:hypothetical protein